MSITFETYRRKSLPERLALWNLVSKGVGEWTAINQLWPLKNTTGQRQNSHRMNKIRNWLNYQLWPPSPQDIADANALGLLDATQLPPTSEHEREVLRSQLGASARLLYGKLPAPEKAMTHLGCRAPVSMAIKLETLGGTKTQHVLRAVENYLSALELKGAVGAHIDCNSRGVLFK